MEPIKLYEKIRSFCDDNGLSETKFGTLCFGNPNFAGRLQNGMEPRWSTIQKALRFMDEYGK